jgi:hypothetical protein
MTTAGPAARGSTTVNVQDVQLLSLGQRTGEAKALAAVPGLGNVTVTSVTLPPSANQDLLVGLEDPGIINTNGQAQQALLITAVSSPLAGRYQPA